MNMLISDLLAKKKNSYSTVRSVMKMTKTDEINRNYHLPVGFVTSHPDNILNCCVIL